MGAPCGLQDSKRSLSRHDRTCESSDPARGELNHGGLQTCYLDRYAGFSVGETYLEHGRHALSFGWSMFRGSTACFVHAVFPSAHTRTGSQTVIRLYDRMVINRRKQRADEMSPLDPLDSIAENI